MKFTIDFNSGGNHGHQLKDALGGWTIGHLFNLTYVHTPYKYLDSFGVGKSHPQLKKWQRRLKKRRIQRISGPLWDGISDYEEMQAYFQKRFSGLSPDTFLIFDKALRIHPFQTIPWQHTGRIKHPIFETLVERVSRNFAALHPMPLQDRSAAKQVAVHINGGIDYDPLNYPQHFAAPARVRYLFPMAYYGNILDQIAQALGPENCDFTIYTETLNAEKVVNYFQNRPRTKVALGNNRDKSTNAQIIEIFKSFITADILVTCNSSFSTVAAYFRESRPTIYHPHDHLNHLPSPPYFPTREDGSFNAQLLAKTLQK